MNEQEFWAILTASPTPAEPIYRLYYDDLGNPLFFSMEDLPGNYIDIDRDTFHKSPPNIQVKDGKLIDYSLGNLVFHSTSGGGTKSGIGVLTLSPEGAVVKYVFKPDFPCNNSYRTYYRNNCK